MNRPIAADSDGAFVLRAGRLYRVLVVVNGETTAEELERAMAACGFGGFDLAISTPDEWPVARPDDWPAEGAPVVSANECVVRASGTFAGPTARLDRDAPIEPGATFTVVQAWDYGEGSPPPAVAERTGLAARSDGLAEDNKRTTLWVLGGVALAAVGAWGFWSSQRRLDKSQSRFDSLAARLEREEVAENVRELVAGGHSPAEAQTMAERRRAAALAQAQAAAGPPVVTQHDERLEQLARRALDVARPQGPRGDELVFVVLDPNQRR